jgi:hypothetical protein
MAALEIEYHVARLERENADKQARINAAVRQLDQVIVNLESTKFGGITGLARKIQNDLRGKR